MVTIFRINCQRQKKRRVQKFARTNNGLVAFLNMRQELELQPTGEIKEHKASASTPNATGAFSGKSAEYVSRGICKHTWKIFVLR